MSRKSIVLSLLMILMLTALSACSSGKETPLESGDITKENVSQVCEILNQAGLSNVDVFGEMAISKNGFAETLPENWSKHGINVESDKCSVISILFKAYEEEAAFFGHTGILIDCRDIESVDSNYLFVEKIAFGDPFKITLVKDENELVKMLSERPDYTSEEGDPAPVVYKNGERIGELE